MVEGIFIVLIFLMASSSAGICDQILIGISGTGMIFSALLISMNVDGITHIKSYFVLIPLMISILNYSQSSNFK